MVGGGVVRGWHLVGTREFKKIKLAWSDLNYSTAKGVLVLSPSEPSIPSLPTRGKES